MLTSLNANCFLFCRWSFLILLYFVFALFLAHVMKERIPRNSENDLSRKWEWSDMVEDRGSKPYVYRALVPLLIQSIKAVTSNEWEQKIADATKGRTKQFHVRPETHFIYFVSYLIYLVCFIGFMLVLRSLLKEFYDFPELFNNLAPTLFISALIVDCSTSYQFLHYDPTNLFLPALAILAIAKRNNWLYYIVLILAALNKETAIFLPFVFVMRNSKLLETKYLASHLVAQLSLCSIIQLLLRYIYQDHPGFSLEVNYSSNIALITQFGVIPFFFFLKVGLSAVFVLYKWKEKPAFLKYSFLILFLPTLLLGFIWGRIIETRMFFESYALLFALSAPLLYQLLGGAMEKTKKIKAF